LHNLGISIGREFITAANDGKIEKKDWSNNVPTVFGLMRGGPSIDFVLGRWWEFILGHTFDKIEKKCGSDGCSSKDVKGVWAGNLYSDKNCKLIQ